MYLLDENILSTYYVLVTLIGLGDRVVDEIVPVPVIVHLTGRITAPNCQ